VGALLYSCPCFSGPYRSLQRFSEAFCKRLLFISFEFPSPGLSQLARPARWNGAPEPVAESIILGMESSSLLRMVVRPRDGPASGVCVSYKGVGGGRRVLGRIGSG